MGVIVRFWKRIVVEYSGIAYILYACLHYLAMDLEKNIIFDFIHGKLVELNLGSQFQWYGLHFLAHDIDFSLDRQIKVLNLFPEPITNLELLKAFEAYRACDCIKITSVNTIKYDCGTIYHKTSKYWLQKETVVSALHDYLAQMMKTNIMISTLCYDRFDLYENTRKKYGLKKLEIAPFQYFGEGFINKPLEFFDQFSRS